MLFSHWQAFHIQHGLCLTIPCIANERIDQRCELQCLMMTESLYCHLVRFHPCFTEDKIGKDDKRTQKPLVMSQLIKPELRDWLKQVMLKPGTGLWMISQTAFSTAFHQRCLPHGRVS